ncbi:MAG: hypothetical protein LBG92_09505 [Prevotellaceae bacterium]|jgi:shikimate dehydrogenase|nr:hypothetical protein [Prevotellaceae bacterium]
MGRYTILGNPAKHSKSPALFAAAYKNCHGLSYDVNEPENAKQCVEILKNGYDGGNITAPFKEEIFGMADEVSQTAAIIEAVNTVTVSDRKIKADNCDHYGVSKSFEEFGVSLNNKSCLLLGIGGAGKAAAYAVSNAGGKLVIVNRTESKAKYFASKLNCETATPNDLEFLLKTADIIVNTLYGNIDIVDIKWLNPCQVILDASYIGSMLLEKAKNVGCTTVDGRYWLYYQALYCFKLFTGIEPDKTAMRNVLNI